MPAAVRFTVNTITPELKAARKRAANLKPALTLFGARMLRSVDENFRRRGRRQGVPNAWPPLSPVTIAMRPKGKRGKKARPLVVTGRLRASTIIDVGTKTLAVGSNVSYANDHHQDGRWDSFITKRERKRVEAHKRTMWIDPKKRRGKLGRKTKADRASKSPAKPSTRQKRQKERTSAAARRRKGIRLSNTIRNQFRAIRRRIRRASGRAPREGLVRAKVSVRQHFQDRTSRIPARPIYVFQPRDIEIWGRLFRNWVIRGQLRKVG